MNKFNAGIIKFCPNFSSKIVEKCSGSVKNKKNKGFCFTF